MEYEEVVVFGGDTKTADLNVSPFYSWRLNSLASPDPTTGVAELRAPGFSTFRTLYDSYWVHKTDWALRVEYVDQATDTVAAGVITVLAVSSDYKVGGFQEMAGTNGVDLVDEATGTSFDAALERVMQTQVGKGSSVVIGDDEVGAIHRIQTQEITRFSTAGSLLGGFADVPPKGHGIRALMRDSGGTLETHAIFSGSQKFDGKDLTTDVTYGNEASPYDKNTAIYFYSGFTGGTTAASATNPLLVQYLTLQTFARPRWVSSTTTTAPSFTGDAASRCAPVGVVKATIRMKQYVEFFEPRGIPVGEAGLTD